MVIDLNNLNKLVARCWVSAEFGTKNLIARKYPAPSEEFITSLFAGELREQVAGASTNGRVAEAFFTDLRNSISGFNFSAEWGLRGLVASVNFHDRPHEGKRSGSDIGIAIRRPIVNLIGSTRIELSQNNASGLLGQAKLGSPKKRKATFKWGNLTKNQKRLYPDHCGYYSLLLYRLSGEKIDQLAPFGWQLCKEYSLNDVMGWLRSDKFPEEEASPEIIQSLFERKIGTEDPEVIRTIIDPEETGVSGIQTIDLRIDWPDDAPPPPSIEINQCSQQRQVVYQRV